MVEGIDVPAIEAKIAKYQEENAEQIMINRARKVLLKKKRICLPLKKLPIVFLKSENSNCLLLNVIQKNFMIRVPHASINEFHGIYLGFFSLPYCLPVGTICMHSTYFCVLFAGAFKIFSLFYLISKNRVY